ncbi:MAG TPA: SpoIIE family protein phosphatase [Streptosporangiaceae bacterium]|nr:SpoIIE family protein phosphatase [Streptosporangiaceae bacterium]
MTDTPRPERVAELAARHAALRRSARSRGAEPAEMLDAALIELEGAIELLQAEAPAQGPVTSGAPGTDIAERQLLRAVFTDAPVPLFLVAQDGTVQRVNRSAGDLIGAKPGYATGRPFAAFVNLPSRAAVQSQLSAVSRTGQPRLVRASLLGEDGLVPSELLIGRVSVRDEADPLIVAVLTTPTPISTPAAAPGPKAGSLQAITRHLDLVTAAARVLLENQGFSESRTLQRCARLIATELDALAIVDLERRHRLRRQFAVGPDEPGLAGQAGLVAAVDPPLGSIPARVHESAHPVVIAHVEDTGVLGAGLDGEPLLTVLNATSVLSVPLSDGQTGYGVLTLVRPTRFTMAELGLVQAIGEQMALAIRVGRVFRRRSDTADALQSSLLPRRMPEIPGVKLAATYLAAAEKPEAGGDFYDVYQTPDGWGLAVGDVCGKGEEAAAVSAAARHAIRVLARRCADPAEVLSGTNEIVLADELALDGGFVTASLAHLSWREGRLRAVVASAGHPAAVLLRADGGVRMLDGGGLPLGLFPDPETATQELTLDVGDVLFLYTDGLAQARGPDHAYFHDRLTDELAGLAGFPPDRLVAAVRQALHEFMAGDLLDDVTMLAVRVGRPDKAAAPDRAGLLPRSSPGPALLS